MLGKTGGKKKVAFRAAGRQLETTVHTSLPPRVQGPLRAYVKVCVSAITWEYSIGPPASKLRVCTKWWGEDEDSPGTIFRVPVVWRQKRPSAEESTTLAFYPVRAAIPQLKAYLKDMKSLKLLVGLGHMTEDSMVIGRCTLPDLSGLSETQPYEDSLPITSSQGHSLGRLHIQIEIQVAKAGQTRLTTPAIDTPQPGFRVGPGAPVRAERRELDELNTEQPLSTRQRSNLRDKLAQNHSNSTSTADNRQPSSQAIASHKAALLAKYIHHQTEPMNRPMERKTDRDDEQGEIEMGPQQREVISELIKRGERLRDAMVTSVLKSGQGGKVGSKRDNVTMQRQQETFSYDVYSSDEEEEKDVDFSMDESDYPLHDPSLLEQLLYSNGVQKTTEKKKVDSAVQTLLHPPPPPPSLSLHPSTKPAPTNSSQDSHPSSTLPIPSSPFLPPAHTHDADDGAHSQTAESGSLTALTSFFSGQSLQKSMDAEILQAVGMERLAMLGRVTSTRVVVEKLAVDPEHLAAAMVRGVKSRPPLSLSAAHRSGTFFVEYCFPAPMAGGGGPRGRGRGRAVRSFPPPHEVVRVASRKIKNGVVRFGHRSVFPVSLVGRVTRQWWHDMLVFNVFYRPPTDRTPFLLGKARVPFRRLLMARSSSRVEVDVMSSVTDKRGTGIGEDVSERTLGRLTVSMHLLCGRGEGHELPCGDVTETATAEPVARADSERVREREREREKERGGEKEVGLEDRDEEGKKESGKWRHAPPIRVKETQTDTCTAKGIDKHPSALQLLLMIPEGANLCLPTASTREPRLFPAGVAPNCYLVCRLFCADPNPKTTTAWATGNPHFNFKQVYSLYLTPSLLEQVCNNFTVVEVWHKTPGTNSDDELLGLVKLSLHQFYLAFSDDSSTSLCLHAELPVIAVDSYCPVVSPFTGNEQGHLAVLLAMGSAHQITTIQQQFAAGSYILHKPYSKSQRPDSLQTVVQQTQIGQPNEEICEQNSGPVHHTFDVTVSGVRGLSVFNNTVWGEADCFVQYHFPRIAEQRSLEEEEGEGEGGFSSEVSLQPFRTDMTLCVPNPTFTHETRHSLLLPSTHPVQRAVMRACGGSSGVPFELWRRFYYPNIRDQLIAKASLPLVKLCALVSMQRMVGPTVQSFSLPMQLVIQEAQGGSGGILEVTVQYQALQDGQQPLVPAGSRKKTHATLSVEILRATGLKDAAVLAAREQPVPLGFAAEVGTNNYAKISFPDLLEKEKRTTKTVIRSFAPNFSHSFDFALPLTSRESVHPYTVTVPLAQRLVECNTVVEIWHQVPKNDIRPAPIAGKVFGRRLAPAFKDVCLGRAVIPLIRLLEKQTGVHGWFPLFPPVHNSDNPDSISGPTSSPDPHTVCSYVGGVEVSLAFSNDEDRKLILARGLELGWRIPEGGRFNMEGLDELVASDHEERVGRISDCLKSPVRWKFCVKMTEFWVPMEAVTISMSEDPAPYLYCFLRYKFFDSDVVVSLPRALSYCCEGRGCYQLNHQVTVTLSGSHDLQWYVGEESMEVEVWSCPTRRQREEDVNHVPGSDDTLLGTAYVPLQALCHTETIGGCYPVFKAGKASLGNQLLVVQVEKSVAEPQEPRSAANDLSTVLEILDTSDDTFVPLKPVSEKDKSPECKSEENRGSRGTDLPDETEEEEEDLERFRDMFEARLVIHQALHLPMLTDKIQQREWPPSAFVTLHPHPKVDKIVTEAIPGSLTPFWNHQCLTHLPNLYLDPHCPGLEFQVWSKVDCPSPPTDCRSSEDSYIGCSHIDLSTLAFGLPQISGWYNITDFAGQIQGQIKVSIVPSQRLSLPSGIASCPLPCSHVMLSTQSTLSQPSTEPATEQPPHASHWNHMHTAPSFTEKSSSVLFRKLRDDLNELDQINSSLKAKVSSGAPDLKSFSSPLTAHIPTALSAASTTTTTTSVSLVLEYSSSGPTLEQHSIKDDVHVRVEGADIGELATHMNVPEPEVSVPSTTTFPSPEKDLVESREMRSEESEVQGIDSHFQSGCSTSSSFSPDHQTISVPSSAVLAPSGDPEGLSITHRAPSETSSLHVQVDALPPSLSESANSHESSPTHSLTDVSTCSSSSHDDASPPASPATLAVQRVVKRQCDIAEDREITTTVPATKPVLKRGKKKETECVGERGNEACHSRSESEGRCVAAHGGVPQSVALLHSCSDGRLTSVQTETTEQQPNICVGANVETRHILGGTENNPESVQPPSLPPDVPSTHSYSAHDKLTSELPPTTATTDLPLQHSCNIQMPEISLPNFFMPPQELEMTMRSLRASALSRPPPRSLFERHSPPYHQMGTRDSSHTASSQSSGVRTLQDVNQFFKSRRLSSDVQSQSRSARCQELSAKAAQRLSRIFTSQPLQTHSEN